MARHRGPGHQAGRHHRRDRDRQGHHGGGGGRRGQGVEAADSRGHRRRQGQHAHRGAGWRRQRQAHPCFAPCGGRHAPGRRPRVLCRGQASPFVGDGRTGSRARDRARHRDRIADHARGAARCHGRGDAARPRRVPDGRGGGAVPGRLQDQPGAARGVRAQTGDRHADHRAGFCRRRRRRRHGRPETDRRVHDLELRHAGDRPDHQLGRQDALYVGRPARLPDRVPRTRTARPPALPPSTASASRPGMRTCPA